MSRCRRSGCRFEAVWWPLFVLPVPDRPDMTRLAAGGYCARHRLSLEKVKVLNDREWRIWRVLCDIPKKCREEVRIRWLDEGSLAQHLEERDHGRQMALNRLMSRLYAQQEDLARQKRLGGLRVVDGGKVE